MEGKNLESAEQSVERAVDLVDRLLTTADGGRAVNVGEYDAQAIIALLTDRAYRAEVMSQMHDFAGMD